MIFTLNVNSDPIVTSSDLDQTPTHARTGLYICLTSVWTHPLRNILQVIHRHLTESVHT